MPHCPQNEYSDINCRVPRYRYARIPLNNLPSGTVSVQPTSSTLMEFKIGASTSINLSRSFVSYNYTIPANGANTPIVFEDGCDLFRNAYFGNGSGLGIVDLQFADCWKNLINPYRTELESFLTNDELSSFYPSRQPAANNILPFSIDGLTAGVLNASPIPYTDQQHLLVGQAGQALNVYRYLPLSCLKDTFLSMDVDSVFGTDCFLRLWTQLGQRVGFYTNNPANPNAAAGFVPIPAAFNLNNVYLYLAIEENLDIRNSLLASLAKGSIKMSVPYTYCYRFTVSGGSAVGNTTLTLTKAYGRGLKRIVYAPYNAQELTQYAFDHNNTNGCKVKSLQSTLSGRPNTDYLLNCWNPNSNVNPAGVGWNAGSDSPADDYREMKKWVDGSCIQNYAHYQSQWVYSDNWGQPLDLDLTGMWRNTDALSLVSSGDYIYSLTAQCPAIQQAGNNCQANGFIAYLYCTFLRTLIIQPDGIIMEA